MSEIPQISHGSAPLLKTRLVLSSVKLNGPAMTPDPAGAEEHQPTIGVSGTAPNDREPPSTYLNREHRNGFVNMESTRFKALSENRAAFFGELSR
jgi:hypothetical protein